MPVRQHHSKSRLGCKQCKARHVRCDQISPQCGLCKRRGLPCSLSESYVPKQALLQPKVERSQQGTPVVERATSSIPSEIHTPTPPMSELGSVPPRTHHHDHHCSWEKDGTLPFKELELLHHFTTVTSLTLGEDKSIQDMWQKGVPKMGLKYDYIMYGILALSALHIYMTKNGLRTEREYHDDALHYYDLASIHFRIGLEDPDPTSVIALFTASSLLCIFALGSRFHIPSNDASNCLDDMVTFNNLGKGVKSIAMDCQTQVALEAMEPLLRPMPWDDAALSPAIESSLKTLTAYASSLADLGARRESYWHAINTLRQTFSAIVSNPGRTTLPFYWYTVMEREFIELLSQRDPVALVIVAHHAKLLEKYSGSWWIGERGRMVVAEICDIMGPGCRDIQAWPPETLEL